MACPVHRSILPWIIFNNELSLDCFEFRIVLENILSLDRIRYDLRGVLTVEWQVIEMLTT